MLLCVELYKELGNNLLTGRNFISIIDLIKERFFWNPSVSYKNIIGSIFHYSQIYKSYVIILQHPYLNMRGTETLNHKTLRGKPKTSRTINCTHSCGAHNPLIKPNELNYNLRLQATIIRCRIIRTQRKT